MNSRAHRFILRAIVCLPLLLCCHAQTVLPATVKKDLTNGTTTLAVNFTLHPIRQSNFNVRVQESTGASLTTLDQCGCRNGLRDRRCANRWCNGFLQSPVRPGNLHPTACQLTIPANNS